MAVSRRLIEAIRDSPPDRAMEDGVVALLFAVQDQLDKSTAKLVQYLLWDFAPVAGLFPAVDRTYRLGELVFGLTRDADGSLMLVTRPEGWTQGS
jgi:hypothetical protein